MDSSHLIILLLVLLPVNYCQPTIWQQLESGQDDKKKQGDHHQSKRMSLDTDLADLNLDQLLPAIASANELRDYERKVSLSKQSQFMLPFGDASDEQISAETTQQQHQQQQQSPSSSDTLLGRYIYAPQHHYHMGGSGRHIAATSNLATVRDHDELYGDAQSQIGVYSPYGPIKPAYAFQKGTSQVDSNLLINGQPVGAGKSTNDLYFLVMVGAFCVMAMAVVLAAGLFAYRVQQNKKTNSDTDYPTYGVVGPNNSLNGKCGAAAFVGGYFDNNNHQHDHHHRSTSGGSAKTSGSAKHLPDLYANGAGSDSGVERGSSKKASLASSATSELSAQQQQQQQQQQAVSASKTTPPNFMANQDAARMYHYQHQKQQMIISDRSSAGRHTSASDLDSEDENDDGSYTVYECPGLASAHEMEIKNPLFNDDQTP